MTATGPQGPARRGREAPERARRRARGSGLLAVLCGCRRQPDLCHGDRRTPANCPTLLRLPPAAREARRRQRPAGNVSRRGAASGRRRSWPGPARPAAPSSVPGGGADGRSRPPTPPPPGRRRRLLPPRRGLAPLPEPRSSACTPASAGRGRPRSPGRRLGPRPGRARRWRPPGRGAEGVKAAPFRASGRPRPRVPR